MSMCLRPSTWYCQQSADYWMSLFVKHGSHRPSRCNCMTLQPGTAHTQLSVSPDHRHQKRPSTCFGLASVPHRWCSVASLSMLACCFCTTEMCRLKWEGKKKKVNHVSPRNFCQRYVLRSVNKQIRKYFIKKGITQKAKKVSSSCEKLGHHLYIRLQEFHQQRCPVLKVFRMQNVCLCECVEGWWVGGRVCGYVML